MKRMTKAIALVALTVAALMFILFYGTFCVMKSAFSFLSELSKGRVHSDVNVYFRKGFDIE